MISNNVFERYEIKYLVTNRQRRIIMEAMQSRMKPDDYGKSTICNIYYDTPDYYLIRRSLEKPVYKEKLRVRSYYIIFLISRLYNQTETAVLRSFKEKNIVQLISERYTRPWKRNEMENRGQYPTNFGKKSRIRYRRPKDAILNGNIRIDLDRVERDWILERCYRVSSTFCGLVANHYPQLSEINSLRLAYGEPPPSKREAISGSLFEGAVSEAD